MCSIRGFVRNMVIRQEGHLEFLGAVSHLRSGSKANGLSQARNELVNVGIAKLGKRE